MFYWLTPDTENLPESGTKILNCKAKSLTSYSEMPGYINKPFY
jgi:hypothetical protein